MNKTESPNSRRTDPTIVKCHSCGWVGQRKFTLHDYEPSDREEVEPIDKCPKCKEQI